MRQVPKDTGVSPLVQIIVGALLGLVVLGVPLSCGSGTQLTALMRCKLEALRMLPADPGMATVYDAADLVERIHACHRVEGDAGQP